MNQTAAYRSPGKSVVYRGVVVHFARQRAALDIGQPKLDKAFASRVRAPANDRGSVH